jgi:secondary thiamine-phosphate synthase enzyme
LGDGGHAGILTTVVPAALGGDPDFSVFLQHTSASLILCENADPDVRRDLETLLSRIAPDGDPAYVRDTEGPDHMAAHARSILTSNSLSIPVAEGKLMLGTWQGCICMSIGMRDTCEKPKLPSLVRHSEDNYHIDSA